MVGIGATLDQRSENAMHSGKHSSQSHYHIVPEVRFKDPLSLDVIDQVDDDHGSIVVDELLNVEVDSLSIVSMIFYHRFWHVSQRWDLTTIRRHSKTVWLRVRIWSVWSDSRTRGNSGTSRRTESRRSLFYAEKRRPPRIHPTRARTTKARFGNRQSES